MTSLPRLVVAADPQALALVAAEQVIETIAAAAARSGRCRLALAGGSTPRALYEELARTEQQERIPWEALTIYWGDERVVPHDHGDSNFRMAEQALLARVPGTNAHRVETERGALEAARHYAALLGDEPLDLVLLGVGDDGHTASLFPGDPALTSPERVVATTSPRPPHERVSLTLHTINQAAAALVLVSGASKAAALGRAHDELRRGQPQLPIAQVQPSGPLTWLIDEAAAARIEVTTAAQTRARG